MRRNIFTRRVSIKAASMPPALAINIPASKLAFHAGHLLSILVGFIGTDMASSLVINERLGPTHKRQRTEYLSLNLNRNIEVLRSQ